MIFLQTRHGSPHEPSPHAGDLGNIVADDDGVATVDLSVTHATLASTIGGTSLRDRGGILSRGLVVHGDEDDLGDGLTETSGLTGSSGSRLACANIEAKAGFAAEFELTLIVIAVLAFIALLLLLLVICLVCYCCCCRKWVSPNFYPKVMVSHGMPEWLSCMFDCSRSPGTSSSSSSSSRDTDATVETVRPSVFGENNCLYSTYTRVWLGPDWTCAHISTVQYRQALSTLPELAQDRPVISLTRNVMKRGLLQSISRLSVLRAH